MLTAIGPYPTNGNVHEGRLSRIHKIDEEVLKDSPRQYLDISMRRYWRIKKENFENVVVYHLNFWIHFFFIFYLCIRSEQIFVHSMVSALYILPIYLLKYNIVTDIHGVIVEENLMDPRHGKIVKWIRDKVYRMAEWLVVKNSRLLIAVTENMKRYFVHKYHIAPERILVIPIFVDIKNRNAAISHAYLKPWQVIYAGGAHAWQCIDKMIQLIKLTRGKWVWTILSGDREVFGQKLMKEHLEKEVILRSVTPEEVLQYYQKNDFGVVLRENNIINQVACPTKLIEYMQNGLIPIVLSPEIGDFVELGYQYVLMDDVIASEGGYPDRNLKEIQQINSMAIENLNQQARLGMAQLKRVLY